jgi:serine/threonine protein kinase
VVLVSQKPEHFGKYILLEKLASGGMAEVFLARTPGAGGLGKFVAIKRILPQFSDNKEFVDMFKDEAKIAINLSHNNLVSIYEFGVEIGQFFLVMDFVKGKNIRQLLNKLKQSNLDFSLEQIVFICKEIAAGLDHAHRCIDGSTGKPLNITHRDMSPQNVMVSFEGEIKIIDFGIAKSETQLETTRAGTLKGKFGYMSPEQAEGQTVDLRTDIFSLGIVLWELLASDRLFIANNEINTLRKIRDCQIPSLTKINPEIHPELERITLKALTKDRNLRYQTSAALHRDLSRFLNRHYPDFSSQDFSMFIKSLYTDEILELNDKLIDYAKIPFNNITEQTSTSLVSPDTVTETSSSVFKNDKKSVSGMGLGLGKSTDPRPQVREANDLFGGDQTSTQNTESKVDAPSTDDPFPLLKQLRAKNAESSTFSNTNQPKSSAQNSIDIDLSTAAPELEKKKDVKLSNKKNIQESKNQKTIDDDNPFETDFEKDFSRNENSSSKIKHNSLLIKKTSFSKTFINLGIYLSVALFSYLLLASLLPKQMSPLVSVINTQLESVGVCSAVRGVGIVELTQSMGFDKNALCPQEKLSLPNNNNQDIVKNEEGTVSQSSKNTPVSININSEPSGAQILINGKFDNFTTPSLIPFTPGDIVTLELRKKDYKPFIAENFDPNYLRTKMFKPKLEKISMGYVSIDAKPPQLSDMYSEIYINGERVNKNLPIVKYPVPAFQESTVELVNPVSNKRTSRKVYLEAEENKSIVIYLKRNPANSK